MMARLVPRSVFPSRLMQEARSRPPPPNTKVQWTLAELLTHAAHSIPAGDSDPPAWAIVMTKRVMVTVVDDSESVRESLPDLLQQAGYAVQTFPSAEAFVASAASAETSCLILDVGLPGMSGPELQQDLIRRGIAMPIVFITAQGDKSLRPRLIAAGAVACLFKPFSDTALLDAVEAAVGMR
jgi:CheY-like chemotaxis protein